MTARAFAQEALVEPDLFTLTFTPAPSAGSLSPVPARTTSTVVANERDNNGQSFAQVLDRLEGIELALVEEETLNGPQSRELVELLTSLANAHGDLGDSVRALAALERARQIVRVNDGLTSLDQVPLVELAIDMLEATAQFNESEMRQDALLELARRNDGDPRVSSVLAEVADRQVAVVESYLEWGWTRSRVPIDPVEGSGWELELPAVGLNKAGPQLGLIANQYDSAIEQALASDDYSIGLDLETPLESTYRLIDAANDCIELGDYAPGFYHCAPVVVEHETPRFPEKSDRELALATLNRARRLYSAAMQAALRDGSYGEFLRLEERLVRTHYFERMHPELHSGGCYAYCRGIRNPERIGTLDSVLRARVVDRITRGASAIEIARALIELGDLYPNQAALERYQLAHDFLVERGAPIETIEEVFSPEIPAIRWGIPPEDLAGFDPARTYPGYGDVRIEIGRFGEVKKAGVVASSSGTSRAIENRLRRHARDTRFRPRFVDGRPQRSDEFTLRYYYDYR